ncbi:MAG: imidazole glycerol phosphate synthase subunit HisH [Proteiniphilum sp.]|jgi:glutamine amidotransferase|nr:imidazole glycerol phosphate synthase subunit HisH [Proteiniphilum sp.]MDD4458556.1 imidazole glycerol phosphate synthase subunit HisH [Proteiniphilum sp.]
MVAIIQYNAGNIASVENAVKRLGFPCRVTGDIEEIRGAEKVIFPGVGEASSAMIYLRERKLDTVIQSLAQPVLGICLGLQLMCKKSEEGNSTCLGIFDATVKKFPAAGIVPHMGWNSLLTKDSPLFTGLEKEDTFYFVHSYYAGLCEQTLASCEYLLPFSAAMQQDNFFATQFHPEKSGNVGEKLLLNFLKM